MRLNKQVFQCCRMAIGVFAAVVGCVMLSAIKASADVSPFDFPEPEVQSSPTEPMKFKMLEGESIVDFDVSPTRPEAAAIVKKKNGNQKIIFWKIGSKDTAASEPGWDVASDLVLSAIAWHPIANKLFLMGTRAGQSEILSTGTDTWKPSTIYRSKATLRRLVVGPRPFEATFAGSGTAVAKNYRIFFGFKKRNGKFSTHSVTEKGEYEYAVLDSQDSEFDYMTKWGVEPKVLITNFALPVGFHPAGHVMLWEDEKKCFQKAIYGQENWSSKDKLKNSKVTCSGSLTYAPNGAALIQWNSGADGATFIYDGGSKTIDVAKGVRFLGTPSSVADGKGLVGVVKEGPSVTLQYVPVKVPLADVVNAWMYLESPKDRDLLDANAGLFRPLEKSQLYELYDTESYHCGSYDQSTPTRPYLVTTDIFWELYAAAFEGIFVLSERQSAMPRFWDFVKVAHESLENSHGGSKLEKAFAAISEIPLGSSAKNPETIRILKAEGIVKSEVTGEDFNFSELKPRGHYAKDFLLQDYFRASKYLMLIRLESSDVALLRRLSSSVVDAALAWIKVYEPFIASSKRPLVWNKDNGVPSYVRHPDLDSQIFPLSWGVDNEVLFSTVYHQNLPRNEQITGPSGPRSLPSGLDLAAVLGSQLAETILEESGEFKKFPTLQPQIYELKKRLAGAISPSKGTLYQLWMSGLSQQWTDEVMFPSDVIQRKFWNRKRIQTGLASWATLRHATVLVNERSYAECGEAGFEAIIHRPPRGYVEPDPKTLDAIARLFDATIEWVKENGKSWKGNKPKDDDDAALSLQQGVVRRLTESKTKVELFRDIASRELAGKPLTNKEYEEILYVGRAAEHNFLIFKSLSQKDFALSTPDPIAKVADVAASSVDGRLLLAGVGAPLEWDQTVPFYGRKQVVKGPSYSYYETVSDRVMTDAEWRAKVPSMVRPAWIEPYVSKETLSCPAEIPE
jgi:hypothetical protein